MIDLKISQENSIFVLQMTDKGDDIQTVENDAILYNEIFVRLFSNPNQSFWAEKVRDEKDTYYSYTAKTLTTVVLNSSGLSEIKAAVKKDLSFITEEIEVSVSIIDVNSVKIAITVNEDTDKIYEYTLNT